MEDVSNLEFFLKMYSELYYEYRIKSKEIIRLEDDIKDLKRQVHRLETEDEILSKSFKVTDGYKHITEID